ncbi:hypothetical protein COBT_000815 [Conglomerata obtusa]
MFKAILLLQNITCSSCSRVVIDKDIVLQQSNPKIDYSIEQKLMSNADDKNQKSSPILQVSNHAQDTEENSSITSDVHITEVVDLQDCSIKIKCDLGLPQHTGTEKNSSSSSIDHIIIISDNNSSTLTSDQNEKSIRSKQKECNFEYEYLTCIEFIREPFMEKNQSLDPLENGKNLKRGKVVCEQTSSENEAIFFDKKTNVTIGVILGMSFLIYLSLVIYISF